VTTTAPPLPSGTLAWAVLAMLVLGVAVAAYVSNKLGVRRRAEALKNRPIDVIPLVGGGTDDDWC